MMHNAPTDRLGHATIIALLELWRGFIGALQSSEAWVLRLLVSCGASGKNRTNVLSRGWSFLCWIWNFCFWSLCMIGVLFLLFLQPPSWTFLVCSCYWLSPVFFLLIFTPLSVSHALSWPGSFFFLLFLYTACILLWVFIKFRLFIHTKNDA